VKDSKIGWTNDTWNPWQGCNKISEACEHCYIGPDIRRRDASLNPFSGPIRSKSTWKAPIKWNRDAEKSADRPRVFTSSLSDFFHPTADEWRPEAWEIIRSCENLDWLILTKRPELVTDRLPEDWGSGYRNVWLGVTVEMQKYLNRIDILSEIPAALRFVSAEPLLEPIRFGHHINDVDWIITGCEQAARHKRRPMDDDWVRGIRDECDLAGVPLFHNQYYIGNQLRKDRTLDGVVQQDFRFSPDPQESHDVPSCRANFS